MAFRRQSGNTNDDTARPAVPDGSRVYAVGDIHGRLDLLEELHELVLADAASCSAARRVIIYLGDYVDRGPNSRGVVEELISAPLPDFQSIYLKGNHEDFLMQFHAGRASAVNWLWNGGAATLESYGVLGADPWIEVPDEAQLHAALSDALPPAHLRFFDTLQLSHSEGDYLFVHAGIRPHVALDEQSSFDLMWIREEFLSHEEPFGPVVVHGHTPGFAPDVKLNRIGIDTGAFRSGCLTCLVLEGTESRFLAT